MIKYHLTFSFHHTLIPCSKYVQIFMGQETANFYVVDLTEEQIRENVTKSGLLTKEGFDEFQENTLSPLFYQAKEPIRYNLNLLFVLPDGMEQTHDMWQIKENMEYMRKLFLKSSDFSKLLFEREKKEICMTVSIGTEKYKLHNFNVALNSSTKSSLILLRELSEALKSPTFHIDVPTGHDYIEMIQKAKRKELVYYYQKLWSMFEEAEVPKNPMELSSTEERCLYLASILSNHIKGKPLLLNLGWGSFDSKRLLNFISTLSDFSTQSGSVVVTCDSKRASTLIKKKVYRANFLESK